MLFSPMSFSPLSFQQANPLLTGMQQGEAIAGQNLANVGSGIRNALMQAQVPYAGGMAAANLAQAQQKAPYMASQTALNMGTLPYLGMKFYGPILGAQAAMLKAGVANSNLLRQWYGTPAGQAYVSKNPQAAQAAITAMQNSTALMNNGLGAPFSLPPGIMPPSMQGGAPVSGLQSPGVSPPLAAPGNYQNPAAYPVLPGGNASTPAQPGQTITPAQTAQLAALTQPQVPNQGIINTIQNQAALSAQKATTDATARQKNLYASNIEKTLNLIKPSDLTQYAGTTGGLERLGQAGLASVNSESTNYDNYLKSLKAAQLLATQVRQFYGDSIQPSMTARLESITNPSSWSTNPKLATNLFNETKNILGMETGTYRQAMQNVGAYRQQPNTQSSAQNAQQAIPATRTLNGKTFTKINGQWYMQ